MIHDAPKLGFQVMILNRHAAPQSSQPELAWITFIHSNGTINVGGFDAHGGVFSMTSIPLITDGAGRPSCPYALWPDMAPAAIQVTHRKGSVMPLPVSEAAEPTGGRIADDKVVAVG